MKIDSAMLLLPRQSVARSAKVNWSRKYPPQLVRQPLRFGIHGRRVVDQVAGPSLGLDQRDLLGARGSRHDSDERQAQEAGEVRLRDGGRAARRLDDRRSLGDPAVAKTVEEQRAGESMLEGARRVDRFVLQVEIDTPLGREREGVQMGVGRAVGIRLEQGHRLIRPGPGTKPLTANRTFRHRSSLPHSAETPLAEASGSLSSNGQPDPRLKPGLLGLPSRRLVFLDSCHTGLLTAPGRCRTDSEVVAGGRAESSGRRGAARRRDRVRHRRVRASCRHRSRRR